ncbi:snapalysin family zinc-dependent metalloprotease [Nocardiopsis coralliicola]
MLHQPPSRRLLRAAPAALAASAALVAGAAAPAAAGDTAPVQQAVLTYDASGAAEFTDAVDAGAAEWNAAVDSVELVPAEDGATAEITVTATDGWPMATLGPVRPGGSAWVEMGRQAMDEGHDPVRVAAHELGHNLGLPDVKPGPCSSLMSGASAGTDCDNATPDAEESARVEELYGSGAAGELPADGRVLVDAP